MRESEGETLRVGDRGGKHGDISCMEYPSTRSSGAVDEIPNRVVQREWFAAEFIDHLDFAGDLFLVKM